MIAGLTQGGVRFVVIGGIAAQIHGSIHITNDLDICYEPAPDNIERLARLLAGWRPTLRGAPADLPFIMDPRAIRTNPVLTLVTDEGWIDVMDRVEAVGDYKKVLENSQEADWHDLRFWVLKLDALITAKKAIGRRKDLEVVLALEALREERRRRGM